MNMPRLTPSLLLLPLLAAAAPAWAQVSGCWNQGTSAIAFGSIGAGTNATTSITLGCQAAARGGHLKYCLHLPEGSPFAGIAPRRMTNYAGSSLQFDLYSDAARQQVIGPQGSGFPLYTGMASVAGNWTSTMIPIPVYGRVPGGQNVPPGNYESQLSGSVIEWAFSEAGPPPSCTQGDSRGSISFHVRVTATVPNNCHIGLATAMDFGSVPVITSMLQSTSTITVRCPLGTPWSLALDDGAHRAGRARRMSSGTGFIAYELFKDAGLSQRWGAAPPETVTGSGQGVASPQPLTVHGRVLPQGPLPHGNYIDTVTVVLTY